MIGIPSYSIFLPLFALFGFFAATTSIYSLIKGNDEEGKNYFNVSVTILLGIIFFLAGTVFSIGSIWSTFNFRNVDISKVKGFRVIKSDDEYKNDNSQFISFDDAQSVRNALQSLKNCSETTRNHESYRDGYKFQIIFTDENSEKDLYISVYRKNNASKEKSVVMPHYHEDKNLNLGEYNCPAFQDWVRTNIDPLFQNQTK